MGRTLFVRRERVANASLLGAIQIALAVSLRSRLDRKNTLVRIATARRLRTRSWPSLGVMQVLIFGVERSSTVNG